VREFTSDARVFVAGHRGLVGSAIVRRLSADGFTSIVTRSREELDLLDQTAVHRFFKEEQIDFVFMAAAKVGGIHANATQQADFLYENLALATNVIHAAAEGQVDKLLFLGSSCIYPKHAEHPIREDSLLTGPLEPTNEGYAIAKIAGLKLCEMYHRQYGKRFISAMPTNLYGPGDDFHPEHSHVVPGMLRRFHEARSAGVPPAGPRASRRREQPDAQAVTVWGTGKPLREFLHVDDLAAACVRLMEAYEEAQHINIGSGEEVSIAQLAEKIAEVTGYRGGIRYDSDKPDGTMRKLLDSTRIRALGWKPEIDMPTGLKQTYDWALQNDTFSGP
jgi:GDP-L-fucose synthase